MKKKILFLCTGNSCRSQMAEGFAKAHLSPSLFEIYSAGTKKHGLNPRAVQVMKEAGVDISSHHSKTLEELPQDPPFDLVFTVCDDAHETCPYFPQGKIIHRAFDDPPRLTQNMKNEEEILEVYRKVRDEIKNHILEIKNQYEL